MSIRHLKPVYWGLFSVGGTAAALLLAPIILVLCLLLPLGWIGEAGALYDNIHVFVANPWVYLVLCGVIFTFLWHGAHRFYYILHDMHVHVGNRARLGFYGFAVASFLIALLVGWF